ncbi:energy transducer TonB [Tenacibaculum finnmarkense]|uniref:energy transducer TonB n=1 Tax=Tenacibaculum finnmarkense TaxID=2781243 RepID=UPI000A62E29D
MKNRPLLLLIMLLSLFNMQSQVKVCETPKDDAIDLNVISVKKCDIKEKKVRQISKTNIARKRVNNRSRKKENNLNSSGNKALNLPNLSKEVLFTLVEEIPMFDACKHSNRENNIKCFKEKINKHILKNFYAEDYITENTKTKVYIQFSIDLNGKIINSKIRSRENNKQLHKELDRIINKLPRFNPGKEKGLPVVVTYAFPLNLASD